MKSFDERFSRNILIKEIGEIGQKKLSNSSVLVCGAGGLGSTVIANLASVGIGKILIVDYDKIEQSNLNRQYIHKPADLGINKVESAKNWIKEFNPQIEVKTYNLKLDEKNHEEITKECGLIIDCFDSFNSKFTLNKIAAKTGKTLIHGGVSEFFGQITTIIPGKTACLRCFLPQENAYIAKGVISPAVSAIASIQAMEAVKNILEIGETLENKLLSCDFLNMELKKINLAKNPNCHLCSNLH